MSGPKWWKQTTQLRDIKDPSILNHQIARQQLVSILNRAIQHSTLPEVLARIILTFVITERDFKDANNNKLQFKLYHIPLSPQYIRTQSGRDPSPKVWKANYKYCLGMDFKLHQNTTICGVELVCNFGGVQCYAVLAGYLKTKEKSVENGKSVYKQVFSYKLVPSDHRQKAYSVGASGGRKTQMIFTEIDDMNNGGLVLSSKNMIYRLGFVISDNYFVRKHVNFGKWTKKQNKAVLHENIKCALYRMVHLQKLLGKKNTYFGEGSVEDDGGLTSLNWFPVMGLLTF